MAAALTAAGPRSGPRVRVSADAGPAAVVEGQPERRAAAWLDAAGQAEVPPRVAVVAAVVLRQAPPGVVEETAAIAVAQPAAAAARWRASAAPNSHRAAAGVAGVARRGATPWDRSPAVRAPVAPRAARQRVAAVDGRRREPADGRGHRRQAADWANSPPTPRNHARRTPVSERFRATMRGPTPNMVADFRRPAHDFSTTFPGVASPRPGRLKANMAKGWKAARTQQTRGPQRL